MSLGPLVRRMLGPLERPVAAAYRRAFFDLRSLCEVLATSSRAHRILEVGCGAGLLAERIVEAFPDAFYTGIDLVGPVGTLFAGDRSRVEFRVQPVGEVARTAPGAFDLVAVVDVLHHVAPEARREFLQDALRTVAPGGAFVLKDWERRRNLPHLVGWFSDRVVSGAAVRYETASAIVGLLREVTGGAAVEAQWRLPPWRNNVAFLLRR